jgi:hypothetical protein
MHGPVIERAIGGELGSCRSCRGTARGGVNGGREERSHDKPLWGMHVGGRFALAVISLTLGQVDAMRVPGRRRGAPQKSACTAGVAGRDVAEGSLSMSAQPVPERQPVGWRSRGASGAGEAKHALARLPLRQAGSE